MMGWLRRLGPRGVAALSLLTLLAITALLAPWLPMADPAHTALDARLTPPLSPDHLLGADRLGRDLLSRVLWGTRSSLVVAAAGTLAAAIGGTALGLASGALNGWVDELLMRATDLLLAFPYLLLALAIITVLGPGLENATLAIAIVNIPFFARAVRAQTLSLAEQDFIAAARVSGASTFRIMRRHMLPNVMPTVVVASATTMGWMLLETAGLSFLGLGAQPPHADLGGMLGQGREVLATAPHASLVPGLTIVLIVVAINALADALRDALDPRLVMRPEPADHHPGRPQAPNLRVVCAPPILEVANLSVAFAGAPAPAVDGVTLCVRRGDRLAVVGESGAGKSTVALAAIGLVDGAQSSGTIRFRCDVLLDDHVDHRSTARGRSIGYVPQDPLSSLHPMLTIGAQIREALEVDAVDRDWRRSATHLLEEVGIAGPEARLASYPHQLSGGMRQRIALAIALAGEPELLIADEPTTALDVTVQARIVALLERLCRERRMALLLITHDLGIVAKLCNHGVVMRRGRVVEEGSIEQLFGAPGHPHTAELVAAAQAW